MTLFYEYHVSRLLFLHSRNPGSLVFRLSTQNDSVAFSLAVQLTTCTGTTAHGTDDNSFSNIEALRRQSGDHRAAHAPYSTYSAHVVQIFHSGIACICLSTSSSNVRVYCVGANCARRASCFMNSSMTGDRWTQGLCDFGSAHSRSGFCLLDVSFYVCFTAVGYHPVKFLRMCDAAPSKSASSPKRGQPAMQRWVIPHLRLDSWLRL